MSELQQNAPLPGPWADRGACKTEGPDVMFPEDSGGVRIEIRNAEKLGQDTDQLRVRFEQALAAEDRAREVCAGCEVRGYCRGYAFDAGLLEHGVFGGMTARERFNHVAVEKKRAWREEMKAAGRQEKGRRSATA